MIDAWRGGAFIFRLAHVKVWLNFGVIYFPAFKPTVTKGAGYADGPNSIKPVGILHNLKFDGLKRWFIKTRFKGNMPDDLLHVNDKLLI